MMMFIAGFIIGIPAGIMLLGIVELLHDAEDY